MSEPGEFKKQEDARYERPGARWRCGRAACWGAPCANGPKPDGTCGAEEGQPRCVPRPTLRVLRGRVTCLVAAATVLLLAAGFHFGAKRIGGSRSLTADPGPLSATHAHFTANQGCAACHPAHDAGLGGLVRAALTPHDVTAQCMDCHTFGGKERLAHNKAFPHRADLAETRCTMCHTEHHGAEASLTSMSEAQCQHCHQVQFNSFTRGHPAFRTNFPQVVRSGIQFNHTRHLDDYFSQAVFHGRAPATCQECHAAASGERAVRTVGFEQVCARCHAQDCTQTALAVFTLPEPTTNAQAVLPARGATLFMDYLLGGTNAVPAVYNERLRQLLQALTKGPGALANLADQGHAKPVGSSLLAGLNPELAARPVRLWWQGKSPDEEAGANPPGWSWTTSEELLPELQYIPLGHADPVPKAWIEFALAAAARATNADQRERAVALRDRLLDPKLGMGRCVKCHSVSETVSGGRTNSLVEWRHRGSQLKPHTVFSHGTHVGLASCVGCHALNPRANFEAQFKGSDLTHAVSNFRPITTANCRQCHAEGNVRGDCFLCHRYHESHGLRRTVLTTR